MDAIVFLVRTVTDLYMLVFVLRIVLQLVRADFYNPFSQFVLRATNPLVSPLRRIVPRMRSIDLATLTVLVLLECIATGILLLIVGTSMPALTFAGVVVLRLIRLTLWFYTFATLIYVILGWVAPAGYNPVANVLSEIVSPLLRPVRRWLPLMGGLDLSPLVVLIAIQFVLRLLPALPWYLY